MQNNQKCLLSDTPQGQQEAGSKTEVIEKEAVEDPELSNLTDQMSVSDRGNINKEVEDDGEQDEWKESWEDEQENELLSWHHWNSSEQSSHSLVKAEIPVFTDGARSKPLEQRQRPGRWTPTHFITFRADTPTFLSGFQRLQEDMTSLLPLSAPHWVSPEKLHVTLCLLVLPGPREVRAACELLREFARNRGQRPLPLSFPPKLGHFEGRVLFLTPQPLSGIQSLNKHLQKVYSEKGWLHMDSVSPNYHLTLAKMKGNRGERVFGGGVLDTYSAAQLRAIDFGKLAVNKLYLCVSNRGKREDGFYETVCVVNLQ
ncbi:hypothetical protein SKAU_G00224710 [Synaphobranchus kaupii]|uniref:A-kinase anchor protein 7-like phosphoesterase domain-containing protein n=1 Tax=Synaphobranchus kaupii TaxID=118154 RepID=A0A9Q1IVV0_SYNKA|nr:hypothetical protein SKAU_G00224710 [Synaphobranchus kaupii]